MSIYGFRGIDSIDIHRRQKGGVEKEPVSTHQIHCGSLWLFRMGVLGRDGTQSHLSRDTKFKGANGDRKWRLM